MTKCDLGDPSSVTAALKELELLKVRFLGVKVSLRFARVRKVSGEEVDGGQESGCRNAVALYNRVRIGVEVKSVRCDPRRC